MAFNSLNMKISIITINYNNREGLQKTIESVINQAYKDFEYIVIDGNSTDGSKDVLEQYKEHFAYWVSESDAGIYNAMNKGTQHATGDYLLFLNSGDWLHDNNVLSSVVKHLEDFDLIIGKNFFPAIGTQSEIEEPITMRRFYVGSIPHQSTFIKREVLVQTPYDENYRIVSDWKFFIQTIILANASYKLVDIIVADFDTEGISTSQKSVGDFERVKVLNELFPERVLLDYVTFEKGDGYQNTNYDRFYIKLRDYHFAPIIYTLSVLLVRFFSIFKKSAGFAKTYPLRIKK